MNSLTLNPGASGKGRINSRDCAEATPIAWSKIRVAIAIICLFATACLAALPIQLPMIITMSIGLLAVLPELKECAVESENEIL